MEILGMKSLMQKFKEHISMASREDQAVVSVGFSAAYALYVHENNINVKYNMKLKGLPRPGIKGGNYWDPHGQNKFLETPFREMEPELKEYIPKQMKSGKTISEALLMAGLKVQREAMKRVPVVTGNLKASAFTNLKMGNGDETDLNSEGAEK